LLKEECANGDGGDAGGNGGEDAGGSSGGNEGGDGGDDGADAGGDDSGDSSDDFALPECPCEFSELPGLGAGNLQANSREAEVRSLSRVQQVPDTSYNQVC
jgi:hypothetical protein